MAGPRARRATALAVLGVVTTAFSGGAGWTTGRAAEPVAAASEPTTPVPATPVPAPGEHAHHGVVAESPSGGTHHAHHGHGPPRAGAAKRTTDHKSHAHDCQSGVCRCDEKCPPRRSAPCGGAMRSCPAGGDEAGPGPGPVRPFLPAAKLGTLLAFDATDALDAARLPLTRDLEPPHPPPRPSSV